MKIKEIMSKAQKIRTDIMEILSKIEDVSTLKSIHSDLVQKKETVKADIPLFMEAVRPIKEDVSLDEMIADQNYKPITYDEFRAKVDDLEWEETLDELLNALN